MSARGLCLSLCLLVEFRSAVGSEVSVEQGWSAEGTSDEDRLFDELFKKRYYNRHSRPVVRANESLNVSMAISVVRILELNEKEELFRTSMWLKMNWKDPKLTWEPSAYGGLRKLSVPAGLIWLPDIVLFDSAENGAKLNEDNLLVDASGWIDWFPKAIFTSYCHIDIALFPFDEQLCTMRFESWSYDTSKLNLSLREKQPLILDYYNSNSEWDLIAKHYLVKYQCCEMPMSGLEFCLRIRRRVLFYGYNLILPCTLISILATSTYILPPQSTERIGLGITTLLALTVSQLMIADLVPPTSDALPLIGLYFGCVMIMNTLSVISMVFVSNMYSRSSALYAMPHWMKQLVCNRLGRLLRLRRSGQYRDCNGKDVSNGSASTAKQADEAIHVVYNPRCDGGCSNHHHQQQHHPLPSLDGSEDFDEWKYAALVIDRLCFCICVIYLTTVTLVFYAYAIVTRI